MSDNLVVFLLLFNGFLLAMFVVIMAVLYRIKKWVIG